MSTQNFNDLTCVIPTHNRSQFLRRQLDYIRQASDFPSVLVIDSSGQEHAEVNRGLVTEHSTKSIGYRHNPTSLFEKLSNGLESVKTPYVVLCADDDTLAPAGIAKCLQVIQEDPDLSTVIGRSYILNTGTKQLSIARGYSLDATDPVVRMQYYVNNWFSNFYAIHRRERLLEQLRLSWGVVHQERSRLLKELLDSLLSLCGGRLKFVDVDYLMYQIHDDNYSKNSVAFRNPEECDQLVNAVGVAISEYLLATGNSQSVDPQPSILKMLNSYMTTQRIPGRPRSRMRKITRELQKLARRVWGDRKGSGWLEKRDLPFSETELRDLDLRLGFRASNANPKGCFASGNISRAA